MRISGGFDGSICGAILPNRPLLSWSSSATGRRRYSLIRDQDGSAARSAGQVQELVGEMRPAHFGSSGRNKQRGFEYRAQRAQSVKGSQTPQKQRIVRPIGREAGSKSEKRPEAGSSTVGNKCPEVGPTRQAVEALRGRKPTGRSEDELLAMIDGYEPGSLDEHLKILRDPCYDGSVGGRAQVTEHGIEHGSPHELAEAGQGEQRILSELGLALQKRLRRPHEIDLETIYDKYHELPEPRILFLCRRSRHLLLRVLATPERKDLKSMLRYFAVVSDVKSSGIRLTVSEWNAALSFTSRYVGSTGEAELRSALQLWREMEHEAGVRASSVTFNVLFDVASKAGRFALAEMIYREMEARGLRWNRYHHVSLIHFLGLQLDTKGVRAAYREMVRAGEMVDTVVLNCLLMSFLRAGEEDAADRLYARMKAAHPTGATPPVRSFATERAITKMLLMYARLGRRFPKLQPVLQGTSLLVPDLQTYRILINYYGLQHGNLRMVVRLLDDMKFFAIPLHAAIFLALFKAFERHGGWQGSPWTAQRLTAVFAAFLKAHDDGGHTLEIRTWLAGWSLRAFKRCSTSESVMAAYDQLKVRWRLGQADEQYMIAFLGRLICAHERAG